MVLHLVAVAPIIPFCHCLATHAEHVLNARVASEFGVNSGQLVSDSYPITRFVRAKWRPPILLDQLMKGVYYWHEIPAIIRVQASW